MTEPMETREDTWEEPAEALEAEEAAAIDVARYRETLETLREAGWRELTINLSEVEALVDEVEQLRAELRRVDAVLARRPALDKPTRARNIEHAITVASKAAGLGVEVERLRAEVQRLRPLEWSGMITEGPHRGRECCPICFQMESEGHGSRCVARPKEQS